MSGAKGRISGTTVSAKRAIDSREGSTVALRQSTVTGQVYAVLVWNGQADLGTASDPGVNRITGKTTGLFAYSTDGYPTLVRAAGNTWRPNVQGADAQGFYAHERVTTPQGAEGGNFVLTEGATIEF
ncbi:hypothetical protein LZC95_32380 [Pendulispora brunnea]|uniref:Uncharacterized protein n=1 Tax=Pendulispora brunnea TaxID=2905690 RepID=A0ABZ2JXC3_9BACT